MDVPYPISTLRFLRVTVLGWMDLDSVESAKLELASPPVHQETEILSTIMPVITEDPATKSTLLTLDQGVSGLPIEKLYLTSTTPVFDRAVTTEVSEDGKNWSNQTYDSYIRRLRDGAFVEESLAIPMPSSGTRYQRIRVRNLDDKPLQFGSVQCEGRVRLLSFRASEPGQYWVYYGNSSVAEHPHYDLLQTLTWEEKLFRNAISPGPAELNSLYRAPVPPRKPWSEEHPAILYTALGGAVLALGVATFRFASRLRPSA
jgi:hypothetical protein